MIKLFDDVIFSPLHVSDLSVIIYKIIVNNAVGIYNAGSSTPLSKYEFGLILADIFNFESKYIEKSYIACAKSIADRPHNMSLSTNKLSLLLQTYIWSITSSSRVVAPITPLPPRFCILYVFKGILLT